MKVTEITLEKPQTQESEPARNRKSAREAPATDTAPDNPTPASEVGRAEMEEAIRELERRFDVQVVMTEDESTGRSVVRILSQDGERVLRQMPPEAALRMAARARAGSLEGILTSVA